jgi:hypothetical protein
MLREMSIGQQGGRRRRWFADEYFDLIVWFTARDAPDGFQLCYDRNTRERAVTWTEDAGYSHDRIDNGEGNPTKNRAPVLLSDGSFPAADVLRRFEMSSATIEPHIRQFAAQKLREYATRGTANEAR